MRSEPELRFLSVLVDRDASAIDVGANLGNYSVLLSELVASGRLHAFEPVPSVNDRLRRLVPAARVYAQAVSSRSGVSTLRVPSIDHQSVFTRATLESGVNEVGQTGVTQVNVTVTTLDAFSLELGSERIGFVKVDVEGHERDVIRGAEHILAVHKPALIIEVEQRHHEFPIHDIFEEVVRHDYRGLFIDVQARSVRPLSEFNLHVHQDMKHHGSANYVANFIFLPKARYDEKMLRMSSLLASF